MSCATGNALSLIPLPRERDFCSPSPFDFAQDSACGRRLALSLAEGGWGMRGSYYITHLGLLWYESLLYQF